MSQKKEVIDDFILLKLLRKNAYGEVYLSTKKGSNEYFIIKKINRLKVDKPNTTKNLDHERRILKVLNHQNICKLKDYKKGEYLVMEYVNGGCLSDCLKKYQKIYNSSFSEDIVQHLMRQIIDAFKYIHGNNIMHRDIKLENIMVNFSNDNDRKNLNLLKAQVKIIDFSLAKVGLGSTVLCNPGTTDPNILKNVNSPTGKTEAYDKKMDIWSIGAVCYNMIIGKPIFESKSLEDLLKKVELGNYVVPPTISKELLSFLFSMLQYESEKRLSAGELAKHPFLTKNVREFQKMDTKKILNKINDKGLNINIKKNETIRQILNGQNELDSSIKTSSMSQSSRTIINSSDYGSFVTKKFSTISNNSNMSNSHFIPNMTHIPRNGPFYNGPVSYYGQPMIYPSNNKGNISRNMPITQNHNMGININKPSLYNSSRINVNFTNNQNSDNLPTQPSSINNSINNNACFNINSKNEYKPMNSDDFVDKNCSLM